MNIDRPLDEIVKEAALARKAERAAKRKEQTVTKKPKGTDPAKTQPSEPKLGVVKKGPGAISKNQRRHERKTVAVVAGGGGGGAGGDAGRGNRPGNANGNGSAKNGPAPRNNGGAQGVANRLSTSAPNKGGGGGAASRRVAPKGVKIRISNLHPGVTETDIAELFETVGPIKKAHLKTFANGHSASEAEVVFERMADALEAISRYNQVPLDNHPLHITLATDSIASPPEGEPVHTRMGKARGRAQNNGRKKTNQPMDDADFADEDASPDRGNGYGGGRGNSPDEDRQGGNGRRQNRRRYRRYQNKAGNANGNANGGDRDAYD